MSQRLGEGEVSLALALAAEVAGFIPLGGMVVWMALAATPPARWLAERRWLMVALWVACGLGAVAVAGVVLVWVGNDLIGRHRIVERRIVAGAFLVLAFLWVAALSWAQKRVSPFSASG